MRVISFIKIFFFLFCFSFSINAQTDTSGITLEDVVDDFINGSQDQNEAAGSINYFEQLFSNPIDINSANSIELQSIPYIDSKTAGIIIRQRETYGPFFSVKELYSIKEIPLDIINKILPFIKIGTKFRNAPGIKESEIFNFGFDNKVKINYRSRFFYDIQQRQGFKDGSYKGSPLFVFNRLKLKFGENISSGILIQKDAGEISLIDFLSFFIELKDISIFDNIILGDYQLYFGNGLTFSGGYGNSKGSNAILLSANKYFLSKPKNSSAENNYYRGITFTTTIKDIQVSSFFSTNNLDAVIDLKNNDIISRPITGYHRTSTEITSKNKSKETLFGASIGYEFTKNINSAFLIYHSYFSNAFVPAATNKSYSNFNYFSFFTKFDIENFNLNLELTSDQKKTSTFGYFTFDASKNLTFSSSIRNYPVNYFNLHGAGFGEKSSAISNETGYYTGFRWRTKLGVINFYFDQFYFPYSSYNVPLPSSGNEFLFDISSKLAKNINLRFRLRREIKETTTDIMNLSRVIPGLKYSSKIELNLNFTNSLKVKNIFAYNNYYVKEINSIEDGFLFSQSIYYSPRRSLNLQSRICIFKSNSINSAIYEYENDLPGFLTGNVFIGEGLRWYFIFSYELFRSFNISIKYSETFKPKDKAMSSGDSKIDGNLDNSLEVQFDIDI